MHSTKQPVEEQMRLQAEMWEAQGDPRAIFLSCYHLMTLNMLKAIDQGEFSDPAWVENLLNHFAGYYFNALEAYEKSEPDTPEAWRVAFEAARQSDLSAIQHLLLGVNAHINYDLVLAEVDLLDGEWARLPGYLRQQRLSDHNYVNQVIGRTIDSVQDSILERRESWLDLVDRLFGRADEWLISRLISAWRDDVWQEALLFLETPDQNTRASLRKQREQNVTALARKIMLFD